MFIKPSRSPDTTAAFATEDSALAEIVIDGLIKSFGATPVLRDVSLRVADGEFVSLLGPSGCGKTTLLRIVAGLETQDAGTVRIGARAVDDLAPKARDVAMVFQSYALYPYMTVAENIGLPLQMRRLSRAQRLPLIGASLPGTRAIRADIEAEIVKTAEGLGIGHLLDRRPGQLSGGQRQRVALARAMVRHPAAFLMDEPLSNLDAKLRVKARAEIAGLHRRLGATFVYVTHDQTEAMTMSDRVAVMMEGRIAQFAAPQTLYDDPETLAVAAFIGAPEINVLPAKRRGDGAVEVAGAVWSAALPDAGGAELHAGVRPESWRIAPRAAHADPAWLAAEVRHIEHLGSETLIHCALARGGYAVVARVEPALAAGFHAGDGASLAPDTAKVLYFGADGARLRGARPMAARIQPALAHHG